MTFEELKDKALSLPYEPGVYIMQDKTGTVIYVGKAKKLKNRVSQYFQDTAAHTPKTRKMVSQIDHFDTIVARSEFEALVLECSLIKRHMPKYNILLKDDKGYPYLRVDLTQDYPVMQMVSKTAGDKASYFGPFGGRSVTQHVIDTLRLTLKLPGCSKQFPRDLGKDRPCLSFHMNNCDGWCQLSRSQQDYHARMEQAVLILQGNYKKVADELRTQMEAAADKLQFELAASLRDRLRAIEGLKNHQRVIATAYADTDAVGFARGAKCCFTVLHFTDGNLTDKDKSFLEEPMEPDGEALAALVQQYYESRGAYPRQVLLPCALEGQDALERLLTEAAGHKVALAVPQRGDKCRLTEMAAKNAREEILIATTKAQRSLKTLEWLQRALELDSGIVAGMTVFQHGRPRKSDYRKFRIRTTDGQNDYGAMHEALTRRFQHYLDGDPGFCLLPDLLLIDGGAEHAAVAQAVLDGFGLSVPVFGMVKDDRHRTRALITPGGHEIGIAANPAVFSFIGTIQEETHRFSIDYQRRLRRESLASELDQIPGVGEKRRNALLREFRSVKAIRAASYEALCAAVPAGIARAVYDHYHPKGESPCV